MSTNTHGKHATEKIIAATGTIAGAVVGSVAGPAGAIAGAIVGGVAGAAAGAVLEDESIREHAHDEELDEAIGVSGGPMGAASPNAPKARVGAFSSGAAGAGGSSAPPSSGPIQDVAK